jgi:hypothetical protein
LPTHPFKEDLSITLFIHIGSRETLSLKITTQ